MATFPTLTATAPLSAGYTEGFVDAGDLVSPTEAGYKITRRQFTRRPRTFSGRYYPLTDAEKATMDTFVDTHGTTGNFDWTQPITATVRDVRFVSLPKFSRRGIYWAMDLSLEEV